MTFKKTIGIAALAAMIGAATPTGAAQPVNITYGYHPYWTGGWNGVVIKHKELWKKYLPAGSTVRFEPHLTGPPMVNAMLADKMQIGTMGDMPSLVATTRRDIGDLRLVSVPMYSAGQQCNKIVVRKNAPDFKTYQDAMTWMSGKPFAVHRGTCANRFIESIIAKSAFKPSELLFTAIEVIASNFESGKLDAAAMWEPHARRVVELGYAKYAATGAPWNEPDANFSLMRQDFIEKNPDAAVGWIKAEIEAVRFMIEHPNETAQMIVDEVKGYDHKTALNALYEGHPDAIGGTPVIYVGKMIFDDDVIKLMKNGYAFLHQIKVLKSPDMPKDAINDAPLKKALAEMRMTGPIGTIERSLRK
jgi:NitT/TauT family transport system substrate-binding protein